jgi:hypothetical protein
MERRVMYDRPGSGPPVLKNGAAGRGCEKGGGNSGLEGVRSGKNLESFSVDYEGLNKHCYSHRNPPP